MPRDALPPQAQWRARLGLGFERRGGRSVLARREHDGPLVVQKALHPEGEAVCHAIVVHPPGGIAGGDELTLDVRLAEGSHALLTTPGAAKWYRSAGPVASQRVAIDALGAAALEWLPQEAIVFDGANATIEFEARLDAGARMIAWDIFCLGRAGSGERFTRGAVRLASQVRRDGRLVYLERGCIEPGSRLQESAAGLAGRTVFGTMIVSVPSIDPAWVASWRDVAAREGEGAVTSLPGLLLARYRGDAAESAREYFAALWKRVRGPVMGREAVMPRIWST